MKDYINKLKSILKIPSLKKVSYDKKGLNPGRDWTAMLLLVNVLVLSYAVYAFYVYKLIQSDTFVARSSVKNESEIRLNTNLLSNIVLDQNKRAENTKKIISGSVPSDPSI